MQKLLLIFLFDSVNEDDNYLTVDSELEAERKKRAKMKQQYDNEIEQKQNAWAREKKDFESRATTLILDNLKIKKEFIEFKNKHNKGAAKTKRLQAEKEALLLERSQFKKKIGEMTKVMLYLQDKHRQNRTRIADLMKKKKKLKNHVLNENKKSYELLEDITSNSDQQ